MSAYQRNRKKRPLEKSVQFDIKCAAEKLGFVVSDFSQPRATMQTPGIPDLFLTHPAKRFTCWVEVKRPGGTLSDNQKTWHTTAGEAGNHVFTCDSVSSFVDELHDAGFPVSRHAA